MQLLCHSEAQRKNGVLLSPSQHGIVQFAGDYSEYLFLNIRATGIDRRKIVNDQVLIWGIVAYAGKIISVFKEENRDMKKRQFKIPSYIQPHDRALPCWRLGCCFCQRDMLSTVEWMKTTI